MRVIFGIILGILLTVGGVYLYDAATAGTDSSAQTTVQKPIVNWDVAEKNWQRVTGRVQREWNKLAAR